MWPAAIAAMTVTSLVALGSSNAPQATPTGWILGDDADTKKNPLTADDATLATGKSIFKDKCQRCHGPGGLGDGPDAEPDATEMDLTNPKRAGRNPDKEAIAPEVLALTRSGHCRNDDGAGMDGAAF